MSDLIEFDLGGLPINTVEVDGALAGAIILQPTPFDSAMFDIVLAFTGPGSLGLSDVFCVCRIGDLFRMPPVIPDVFTVIPGRKQC